MPAQGSTPPAAPAELNGHVAALRQQTTWLRHRRCCAAFQHVP